MRSSLLQRLDIPWPIAVLSLLSTICFIGVLASKSPTPAVPLTSETATFNLNGSGFIRNAVYPSTSTKNVPSGISLYGSWIAGDSTMGLVRSSWLLPVDRFRILIAGYPVDAGLSLGIEVQSLDGSLKSFPITAADAREVWTPIQVAIPNPTTVKRFRIVAVDSAKHLGGWLGFSEPYAVQPVGAVEFRNAASVYAFAGLVFSVLVSLFCLPSLISKIRGTRT